MSTTQIKSYNSDNQAIVNSNGQLLVDATISGGSLKVTAINPFGTANIAYITVNTTSTLLLAQNSLRLYAHIVNNSAGPIYIQYGVAASFGQGIRLNSSALYQIDGTALWTGSIYAVTQTGPLVIDVLEGTA